MVPVRSRADPARVAFVPVEGDHEGEELDYAFPAGYSAWERNGKVEVVDRIGNVINEASGRLSLLGGAEDEVCRINGVVIRPW